MNMLIIIIIAFVGFFVLLGGLFFYFKMKSKPKHIFYLHKTNNTHIIKLTAIIAADKDNNNQKRFFFESTRMFLDIEPPTSWIGGEPVRDIRINDLNEYAYLKGKQINETDYIEYSLTPTEKSIALFRYKENANRYQNPVSKMQAYVLAGTFLMVIMILIGVVYSTIAYVNVSKSMIDLQREINKGKDLDNQVMNSMIEISKQQIGMISALNGNTEITRQLT